MRRYWTGFGLLLTLAATAVGLWINSRTSWHPYAVWLVVWNLVAWIGYVTDKVLSRLRGPRIPELMLHLLSLLGGFGGAWTGVVVLRHKSNRLRHPWFLPVIVLSTVAHGVLAYLWLVRSP